MNVREFPKELVEKMIPVLSDCTGVIGSRGEGRRLLAQNGLKLFLVEDKNSTINSDLDWGENGGSNCPVREI